MAKFIVIAVLIGAVLIGGFLLENKDNLTKGSQNSTAKRDVQNQLPSERARKAASEEDLLNADISSTTSAKVDSSALVERAKFLDKNPQLMVEIEDRFKDSRFAYYMDQSTPSDKALKAAAWSYTHSTQAQIDEAKKQHPEFGKTSSSFVRGLAWILDRHPENLALLEADIEKYNQGQQQAQQDDAIRKQLLLGLIQSSRSSPPPPPSIVLPPPSSIHCSSSTIGDYTSTNCY